MGKSGDSWITTRKDAREARSTANLGGWAAPSQPWLGRGSQSKVRELEALDLEQI